MPKTLPVPDRMIHDWFDHPTLHLTMTGVIAKSSNIGTALASTQISTQRTVRLPRGVRPGLAHRHRPQRRLRGLLPAWQSWST